MVIKGQKKTELVLYVVLWTVLFVAPVLSICVGDVFTLSSASRSLVSLEQISSGASADWQGVFNAWSLLVMFFVTFAVHNFFVAPVLVYHNRKWMYGISVVLLFACFAAYQVLCRPHVPHPVDDRREMRGDMDFSHPPVPPDETMMHERDWHDGGPEDRNHEPPRVFGGEDSVAFIIMALLLGLNIGTKYFFKSLDYRKRVKELERESLSRQLKYLKYQISPHFFMNTLNNIHALVDIDSEQAKYTIEVLSKLMRYVLYEGDKTMAPLQKELDFISHYVDLMRIRYTDKVLITVSVPSAAADNGKAKPNLMDIMVPSLLFTTFVENAFKHGVSYRKESFVAVSVRVDEEAHKVEFRCDNSVKPVAEEKHGGVGLQNAMKRLRLMYGNDYHLEINSDSEEYHVLLELPVGCPGAAAVGAWGSPG